MSAAWFTVLLSSAVLEAVCCRLEAVCSVRIDRSWLPLAISVDAVETDSTPLRTSDTRLRNLPVMPESERVNSPNSSRRSSCNCCVKSPVAIASATATARARGWVMERTSIRAKAMLSTNTTTALMMASS